MESPKDKLKEYTMILLSDIPVMENQLMYQAFSRFYGKGRKITVKVLFQRLKSFVRRLLGVDYR